MSSSIIKLLKREQNLRLYFDFRAQHVNDLSGNGYNGVCSAGCSFGKEGIWFDNADYVTVPDAIPLRLTTGTIVCLANFINLQTTVEQDIYCKRDAGGTNVQAFKGNTDLLSMYNGTTTVTNATSYLGKTGIAVGFTSGTISTLWLAGGSAGDFSALQTLVADDAPITIGNKYTYDCGFQNWMSALLLIARPLTPGEHAQLYQELSAMQSQRDRSFVSFCNVATPRPRRGLIGAWDINSADGRGLLPDLSGQGRDMVAVTDVPYNIYKGYYNSTKQPVGASVNLTGYLNGAFPINSAIVTLKTVFKYNSAGAGTIMGHLPATNPKVTIYHTANHLMAEINDGTPYTAQCTDNVTNSTLKWQHLIVTINTSAVPKIHIYLNGVDVAATIAGACGTPTFGANTFCLGYDGATAPNCQMRMAEVYNYCMDATEALRQYRRDRRVNPETHATFATPISTAIRGGTVDAVLEATAWRFAEAVGRWRVDADTIQGVPVKVITCTTAGQLYMATTYQGVDPYDAAMGRWTIWLKRTASAQPSRILLNASASTYPAGFQYYVEIDDANVSLNYNVGTVLVTTAIALSGAWHKIEVSRDTNNLWTLLIDGIAKGTASHATYVTSHYMVIADLTGTLKLSLGNATGKYCTRKQQFA